MYLFLLYWMKVIYAVVWLSLEKTVLRFTFYIPHLHLHSHTTPQDFLWHLITYSWLCDKKGLRFTAVLSLIFFKRFTENFGCGSSFRGGEQMGWRISWHVDGMLPSSGGNKLLQANNIKEHNLSGCISVYDWVLAIFCIRGHKIKC